MSNIAQVRNSELVDLLTVDFQKRHEANFAWKSACSAFLALPGLRGFWPMSSFDENGDAFDLSEQDRTLTYNGNPTYNYDDLAPYIDFDGTGDFLNRVDEAGLDIIGTEAYVASAVQGLTMGGWFFPVEVPILATEYLFNKYGSPAPNYAYRIARLLGAPEQVLFGIYDGVANSDIAFTITMSATWYFIVGRFIPSTEVKVWVNDDTASNTVAIGASINNISFPLRIGDRSSGGAAYQGRASMCFLSTAALSDAIIGALFQQTRAMFGV